MALENKENVIGHYKKIIEESMLDDKKKEELIEKVRSRYEKMQYEHGEAIGVVAAQSISEPATQTTLRAYHRVGATGLHTTQGLPRILEIFDARKIPKTPSMRIYMKKEFNTKEKAREIAAEIKESKLKHITIEDSLDLTNLTIEITLDEDKMVILNITVNEAVESLTKNIKTIQAEKKGKKLVVTLKKTDFTIKDLQHMRLKLREVYVKGIKGIERGIVNKEGEDWVIHTLGSNLLRVLKLEGVDDTRTVSNNIYEIAEVLGIEAARAHIINETLQTLRDQGVDTNIRHLMLIGDAMTVFGEIYAIGRYGLSGVKYSVLARANFEETVKHLTDAAIASEEDHLDGIVENIIVGKTAKVGTGLVKLRVKPITGRLIPGFIIEGAEEEDKKKKKKAKKK